ncbi:putative metallo-beta-lactamase domain protein [Talaromyces proteolyticus]|uniref:Metallo-beta-lactamase domain protein n=1 Tax=Talaromyces proteolyticus TaxID=1131652 RepID=A0AAD4KN43_9EURO|nr:putative metallo-beta-lactamase domain protein [Talaromyces proteolyticus]KAH8695377.1 putative metallo-beta-lactamase domain protein [Talaromyces proteolyticus]
MGLQYKVFYSRRPGVNRSVPAGHDHLKWVPSSSTLIYGEIDAALIDTPLTIEAGKQLVEWVVASGKNLTQIYVTHAHGDHFFGCAALLQEFPKAKVLATKEVVVRMEQEIRPERLNSFWARLFPGEIPTGLVTAEPLPIDEFELEGEKLVVVRTGHTDTDDTTALWVPSIGLVVTGDSVYNNTHPYLGESGSKQKRLEWIASLDKIAALKPDFVVGGHSDPSKGHSPAAIGETKSYLQDFEHFHEITTTVDELYYRMLEKHPDRLNPGSLWGAATTVKNASQV